MERERDRYEEPMVRKESRQPPDGVDSGNYLSGRLRSKSFAPWFPASSDGSLNSELIISLAKPRQGSE